MSYTQVVLGSSETTIEVRHVGVVLGSIAPQPASGYAITEKLFTFAGLDWYWEYRQISGKFTPY